MVSPFVGFILLRFSDIDFNKFFTALTYIGVILILFFATKNNPIRFPKYLWFYLLFILYIYYSAFVQLEGEFKLIYLVYNYAGAFNVLFIVENIQIDKKYYDFLFKLSKKILIIAIIVIIIQQVFNSNFFVRTDWITDSNVAGNEDRLHSIYSWVTILGAGLCFVPVLLIVVERVDKQNKTNKVLLWIFLAILFAILSRARWVMVNTLLLFVVIVISKKNIFQSALKYLFIMPIILILSYIAFDGVGINVKGIVEDRILESNAKSSHQSATTRLLAFTVFNKFYWKNAIFGVGDRKYGMGASGKHNYELSKALGGSSSQIHVGYLSLFYLYGAIGGIFFLLFLFYLLKTLYHNAKKTKLWAPFFGIICFVLANFTLVAFSFLEIGLIFSVLSSKYFVQQNDKRILLNKRLK